MIEEACRRIPAIDFVHVGNRQGVSIVESFYASSDGAHGCKMIMHRHEKHCRQVADLLMQRWMIGGGRRVVFAGATDEFGRMSATPAFDAEKMSQQLWEACQAGMYILQWTPSQISATRWQFEQGQDPSAWIAIATPILTALLDAANMLNVAGDAEGYNEVSHHFNVLREAMLACEGGACCPPDPPAEGGNGMMADDEEENGGSDNTLPGELFAHGMGQMTRGTAPAPVFFAAAAARPTKDSFDWAVAQPEYTGWTIQQQEGWTDNKAEQPQGTEEIKAAATDTTSLPTTTTDRRPRQPQPPQQGGQGGSMPPPSRVVHVRSRDRMDRRSTANTGDFTVILSSPVQHVQRVRLAAVEMPKTWWTISGTGLDQQLFLCATTDGLRGATRGSGPYDWVLSVRPGQYATPAELVAELNAAMVRAATERPDILFANAGAQWSLSSNRAVWRPAWSIVFGTDAWTLSFAPFASPDTADRYTAATPALSGFLGFAQPNGYRLDEVHGEGSFNSAVASDDVLFRVEAADTEWAVVWEDWTTGLEKGRQTLQVATPGAYTGQDLERQLNASLASAPWFDYDSLFVAGDAQIGSDTATTLSVPVRRVSAGATGRWMARIRLPVRRAFAVPGCRACLVVSEWWTGPASLLRLKSQRNYMDELVAEYPTLQSTFRLAAGSGLWLRCREPGLSGADSPATEDDVRGQLTPAVWGLDAWWPLPSCNETSLEKIVLVIHDAVSVIPEVLSDRIVTASCFLDASQRPTLSVTLESTVQGVVSTQWNTDLFSSLGNEAVLDTASATWTCRAPATTLYTARAGSWLTLVCGQSTLTPWTITVPTTLAFTNPASLAAALASLLVQWSISTASGLQYPLQNSTVDSWYEGTTAVLRVRLIAQLRVAGAAWDARIVGGHAAPLTPLPSGNETATDGTTAATATATDAIEWWTNTTPVSSSTIGELLWIGAPVAGNTLRLTTSARILLQPQRAGLADGFTLTLPPGIYTRTEVQTALNAQLASIPCFAASRLDIVTDGTTEFFVWKLHAQREYTQADFEAVFYDRGLLSIVLQNARVNVPTAVSTLGWLLGFRAAAVASLSAEALVNGTLIGSSPISVRDHAYLYLELDDSIGSDSLALGVVTSSSSVGLRQDLPTSTVTSLALTNDPSTRFWVPVDDQSRPATQMYAAAALFTQSGSTSGFWAEDTLLPNRGDFLAVLPIAAKPVAWGARIALAGSALSAYLRTYARPVTLTRFHVRLLDEDGQPVDLNGGEWSFTLVCDGTSR
eukprot:gene11061-12320_t